MKRTRASQALGLAVLGALASQYAAADGSDYWYVGGNYGQSRAKIDDVRITSSLLAAGFTTTSIADDNRDNGYKIFAGYRFNRNFALEGGYFNLGQFGFVATTVPAGTFNGTIKLQGVNLDLVGILPFTERFSVFGRVGVNYARARDHFTGTGLVNVLNPNPSKSGANYKFGAGLEYFFTDALALRAEAERYRIDDAVGNKGDVDLVSVGLVYRLGEEEVQTRAPEPMHEAYVPPPPPPPPAPHVEKYTLSATELFEFNRAELRLPQPKLDEIANALGSNGDINNVAIIGYTDRIGSDQYNQRLSERRANAVKDYLVSKGIDPMRLHAEGRGKSNPIVSCNNANRTALIACLAPNRRVEVEEITIERRTQ